MVSKKTTKVTNYTEKEKIINGINVTYLEKYDSYKKRDYICI